MNNRTIFLDKLFWSRLWPPLMGLISQSITSLISLMVIEWLSGSLTAVFEADEIRRIIVISLVANVLFNGSILLVEALLIIKGTNLFLIPITMPATLRELSDYVKTNEEGTSYDKYWFPLGLLCLNILTFLIPYASGVRWTTALLNSTLAMLPFHIAGLTLHVVKIGIEIIVLFIRYMIQSRR